MTRLTGSLFRVRTNERVIREVSDTWGVGGWGVGVVGGGEGSVAVTVAVVFFLGVAGWWSGATGGISGGIKVYRIYIIIIVSGGRRAAHLSNRGIAASV